MKFVIFTLACGLLSQTAAWTIPNPLDEVHRPAHYIRDIDNGTTFDNATVEAFNTLEALDKHASIKFKGCRHVNLAKSPFQVTNVELSPSPPKHNQNVDISVAGILKDGFVLEKGTKLEIKVKLALTTWVKMTLDVCDQLGVACPVKPGALTLKHTQWIDKKVPRWLTYRVLVSVIDHTGRKLTCAEVPMKLG